MTGKKDLEAVLGGRSPPYRLADENQVSSQFLPNFLPLNLSLNLPYQRAELGTRASLSSTPRANASAALGSEPGAG